MGFTILMTDHGSAEQLAKKLELSGLHALDNRTPLAEISANIFEIEGQIFASGGRRGGGSWAQLKPETIKRKGSTEILVDYSYLKDSVTIPGAPFQILEIGNESLVFGTDRPYAFVHQHGSVKAHVPARPFIRFLPTDISRWTRIIAAHLLSPFLTSEKL